MTIPLVHEAAVRNSCQWSLFPQTITCSLSMQPRPSSGLLYHPLQNNKRKRPAHSPPGSQLLRVLAPALLSQSCSCSPSASPPLTQTRANMPTVSLATVQKPCDSFFLRSWSNANHKIHMRKSLWCDPALTSPTCADLKTFSPGNTLPSDFSSLPMGKF